MKKLAFLLALCAPTAFANWGNTEDTDWTETNQAGTGNITCDVDTLSWSDGDGVVILFADFNGSTDDNIATPGGYTQITDQSNSSGADVWLWEKESNGTESDITITVGAGSNDKVCYVFKFPGDFAGGTIVDQVAFDIGGGLDNSPSITPTEDPSTVFAAFFDDFNTDTTSFPSGMTEVDDFPWIAENRHAAVAYEDYTGTAATGTLEWHDIVGTTAHITFNVAEADTGTLATLNSFSWSLVLCDDGKLKTAGCGGGGGGGDMDLTGTGTFVDCQNGNDSTGDGTFATPYQTLNKAVNIEGSASDNVYVELSSKCDLDDTTITLAGGTQSDPFVISCYYSDDGTPRYCDEGASPTVTKANYPEYHDMNGYVFTISGTDWNVIEMFFIDGQAAWPSSDVQSYILISNGDNNIVQQGRMTRGLGWNGIVVTGTNQSNMSEFNKLLDLEMFDHSTPDDGCTQPCQADDGDQIWLADLSSNTLLESSSITISGHSNINVEGSNNVIRYTTFDQDRGGSPKDGNHAVEFRVTESGPAPNGFNVLEYNIVSGAYESVDECCPQLMKGYSEALIARGNEIAGGDGRAIQVQEGSNFKNASEQCIHNNDIDDYANGGSSSFPEAWRVSDTGDTYTAHSTRFFNNFVGDNGGAGQTIRINIASGNRESGADAWNLHKIFENHFEDSSPDMMSQAGTFALASAESTYPDVFYDNETSSSKASSGGGFAAEITSATSSGTTFVVDFPTCFHDGKSITDADTLYFESGDTATISTINYSTGSITVDQSVSWTQGDGVIANPFRSGSNISVGVPSSITPGQN